MNIKYIDIQNFRKLKRCRIELSKKETIFVGANNSGKTSAMHALLIFLKDKSKIRTTDFTLSNWRAINEIGKRWYDSSKIDEGAPIELTASEWRKLMPTVDVWLDLKTSEVHHVRKLIPTIGWKSGLIGVRLVLEPVVLEDVYNQYITEFTKSKDLLEKAQGNPEMKLWPSSMKDFLENRLSSLFKINTYILNPKLVLESDTEHKEFQILAEDAVALKGDPFKGLIKIDSINAQRGFTDPNIISNVSDKVNSSGGLTSQLSDYYEKHLNPSKFPNSHDISALSAIEKAQNVFDTRLNESFEGALDELKTLGYPGFSSPKISLTSKIEPIKSLNHNTAVQYEVATAKQPDTGADDILMKLPEMYNGLGYQNLISMVFKLIRFRDDWMKVGKLEKITKEENQESKIEPLHLILLEEPEAHLHVQVQQVFIKKAYDILRNKRMFTNKEEYSTQLVVSTHSSDIAHEVEFSKLRYFERMLVDHIEIIPTAKVKNLSCVFGAETDTNKFAVRYLKTTHCDLFFADAIILVEGPAERMLVPHFISHFHPKLTSSYITILEIGGSHAHRLKDLIQVLGIPTLVITDLDAMELKKGKARLSKAIPKRNSEQKTGNDTLKEWLPRKNSIDELLDCIEDEKQCKEHNIRVVYQTPKKIKINKIEVEALANTFEDALLYENIELFKKMEGIGLISKFQKIAEKSSIEEISNAVNEALESGVKAKFALDLLFTNDPSKLKVPEYITFGLEWLSEQLEKRQNNILVDTTIIERG